MAKATAEIKETAKDYRAQMDAIEKAKECAGAHVAKLALPEVQKDFEARRAAAAAKIPLEPFNPNPMNELEAINKHLEKIERDIVTTNKTLRGCPAPQAAPQATTAPAAAKP